MSSIALQCREKSRKLAIVANTPTINVRVPNELREQIEKQAEEERRNFSNMVVVLLEEALAARGKRSDKTRSGTRPR